MTTPQLASLLFLSATLILSTCQNPKATDDSFTFAPSGWQAVYQHGKDGQAIRGSLDSLIAGIRQGLNVRIGWGWERELGDSLVRLEHMAEPLFLSIIQEKHVSAVIDAHPLLESYLDIEKQSFAEGGHLWQCVMTTEGTFHAQVYKRGGGKLLKDWPQRHKMTWFLDYSSPAPSPSQALY